MGPTSPRKNPQPDNRKKVPSDEEINAKQAKKKTANKIYYENHHGEINHDAREHYAAKSEAINKRKRNAYAANSEKNKTNKRKRSAYAANSEKNKTINAARRAKYAAKAAEVSKMKLLSYQSNSYPLTVDCYIYFV